MLPLVPMPLGVGQKRGRGDGVRRARCVSYDCETTQMIPASRNIASMRISVACAWSFDAVVYDSQPDKLHFEDHSSLAVWVGLGDSIEKLMHVLEDAEVVLAYNSVFDETVVQAELARVVGAEQAASRMQALRHRTFDPMTWIFAREGRRFKLDTLLTINNLGSKLADGEAAVRMWKARDVQPLERYCMQDARLLAELCKQPRIRLPNRVVTDAASIAPVIFAWWSPTLLRGNPANVHQLTAEWFELRRGRVTGSIAGAALELSPFLTRARAHSLLRGEDDEVLETAAMARGSRLEPMALLAYQRAMGVAATPCGIFVSKTTDWLASSPDAIVVDGGRRFTMATYPGM